MLELAADSKMSDTAQATIGHALLANKRGATVGFLKGFGEVIEMDESNSMDAQNASFWKCLFWEAPLQNLSMSTRRTSTRLFWQPKNPLLERPLPKLSLVHACR